MQERRCGRNSTTTILAISRDLRRMDRFVVAQRHRETRPDIVQIILPARKINSTTSALSREYVRCFVNTPLSFVEYCATGVLFFSFFFTSCLLSTVDIFEIVMRDDDEGKRANRRCENASSIMR